MLKVKEKPLFVQISSKIELVRSLLITHSSTKFQLNEISSFCIILLTDKQQ